MAEEKVATTSTSTVASVLTSVGNTTPRATGTGGGGTPYTVQRTAPQTILRHDISDEELGNLSEMRRDHIWEGMWAALALATGAAPNAIAAICSAYVKEPPVPMGGVDLIQVIFLFVGAAIAGVLYLIAKSRAKTATDLASEIRARTSQNV